MVDKLFEKGVGQIGKELSSTGEMMMTSERKSIIMTAAIASSVVSLIPCVGWIVDTYLLWNMYSNLCKSMKLPMNFSSIALGFFTNVVEFVVINGIISLFFGLGQLVNFIAIGIITYRSGKKYLGSLTQYYKRFSDEHGERIKDQHEKAQVKAWSGLTWYNDGVTNAITRKADFSKDLHYCLENLDYVLEHLDAFENHFKFFLKPEFLENCYNPQEVKCQYNFLMAVLNLVYLCEHYYVNERGDIDWARIDKGLSYAKMATETSINTEEAGRILEIYNLWQHSNTDENLYRCYSEFNKATDDKGYFSANFQNNLWERSVAFAILHHTNNCLEKDKSLCYKSAKFWCSKFDFSNNYDKENYIHIMWINQLENLGYFYQEGEGGCELNYPEALRIWNLSIRLTDSVKAKFNLGEMYELGKGVEVDKDKSKSLYQQVLQETESGSEEYKATYEKLHPGEIYELPNPAEEQPQAEPEQQSSSAPSNAYSSPTPSPSEYQVYSDDDEEENNNTKLYIFIGVAAVIALFALFLIMLSSNGSNSNSSSSDTESTTSYGETSSGGYSSESQSSTDNSEEDTYDYSDNSTYSEEYSPVEEYSAPESTEDYQATEEDYSSNSNEIDDFDNDFDESFE